MSGACRVTEAFFASGHRAVTIENGFISVTVLPEKGADIYSLSYKPREMDVLWKSPWGLTSTSSHLPFAGGNTEAAWMDQYEGGWQEIFPNGGDECVYRNAPMSFHGEASIQPWDYTVRHSGSSKVSVEFHVALRRSPFELRRTLVVERRLAGFRMEESIVNKGEEALHYMWGHHPAIGDPFLSGNCILQVPARSYLNPNSELSPHARIPPAARGEWPLVKGKNGTSVDLSNIPQSSERIAEFGYICDLEEGWYGLTSREYRFGFGLAWPQRIFPYLWFWQELRGSFGYPWYGRCAVMAVEPFTSIPCSGLASAVDAGTAPLLQAGESVRANLAAVFYDENEGELKSISTEGIGHFK